MGLTVIFILLHYWNFLSSSNDPIFIILMGVPALVLVIDIIASMSVSAFYIKYRYFVCDKPIYFGSIREDAWTPKEVFERTKYNFATCIIISILWHFLCDMIYIMNLIVDFIYWILHVGRRRK